MAGDQHVDTYQPAVASLIDKGHVGIHACDDTSSTPLHEAVRYRNINAVRMLLLHGADPNRCDAHGRTSLWALLSSIRTSDTLRYRDKSSEFVNTRPALVYPGLEITKLLLSSGAKVDVLDATGITILHAALKQENMGLLAMLLERGINVNHQDLEGQTPL
ncbi:ankyrin repeat-containing domain protein, partial [Schizophyllum commune]